MGPAAHSTRYTLRVASKRDLELAARFVAALHQATAGRRGRFRSIADCASRAGITGQRDVKTAWSTAERAGFLVVHVDEPLVMLTEQGREAAHPQGPAGR
jgi:phenylpropionate dioxygenase-like ring-hydroxylating dioxygenase large terminal subunit